MRSKQAPIYPPSSPTVSPCRGQTGSSQSHRCRLHCRKQQSRCWRCRCSSWRPCPRGHNAPPRYSPAGGKRGQRGGQRLRIACCMLCGVCMPFNQPQLPSSHGFPSAVNIEHAGWCPPMRSRVPSAANIEHAGCRLPMRSRVGARPPGALTTQLPAGPAVQCWPAGHLPWSPSGTSMHALEEQTLQSPEQWASSVQPWHGQGGCRVGRSLRPGTGRLTWASSVSTPQHAQQAGASHPALFPHSLTLQRPDRQ